MSKAFTRDDDGVPPPDPAAAGPRLPPGVPNYVTARGHARLLERVARLAADGQAAASAALAERLERAPIVDERPPGDTVRFGDRVTLRVGGVVRRVRIVGVDEVELGREDRHDPLSFLTPLAKALIGSEVGGGAHRGPR